MPATTTVELFGRPAYCAIGDPAQAAGAGMVDLGIVPNVSVKVEVMRQRHKNEIMQELFDGNYGNVVGVTGTLRMMRTTAAFLAALFSEFVAGAGSIGARTTLANIVADTLAIMPVNSFGDGPTAEDLLWITAALPVDIGAFIHKLEESDNATEPWEVQFAGQLRTEDAAAQAINANYQIFFRGSAVDALGASPSQAWTLPSGY